MREQKKLYPKLHMQSKVKPKVPDPDTDDDIEQAKIPPTFDTIHAFIQTQRRTNALGIVFVLTNGKKYSTLDPPDVVPLISRVNELKDRMVAACVEENFAATAEFKSEWEVLWEQAQEQIKLYHLSQHQLVKQI